MPKRSLDLTICYLLGLDRTEFAPEELLAAGERLLLRLTASVSSLAADSPPGAVVGDWLRLLLSAGGDRLRLRGWTGLLVRLIVRFLESLNRLS